MSILHKPTKFVCINGRYVRDTRGTPVNLNSNAKGASSLTRFPARVGRIGYHKWSNG